MMTIDELIAKARALDIPKMERGLAEMERFLPLLQNPSDKMISAGIDEYYSFGGSEDRDATDKRLIVESIFRAMIEAA